MSREVLGDDDDLGTGVADHPELHLDPPSRLTVPLLPPPAPTSPVGQQPGETRSPGLAPPRRVVRGTLGVGVFLLGAGVGWLATGESALSPAAADPVGTAPVAVLLELRGGDVPESQAPRAGGLRLVTARIRVDNPGRRPVVLDGTAPPLTAARPRSLTPLPQRVAGGARTELTARIDLGCGSPQALDLPELTYRTADGLPGRVPVYGAFAELTRWCQADDPAQSIQVRRASEDDARLRIDLSVPSGRTTRVATIEVDGQVLTGRPLPAVLDGQVRSIWLNPPACDPRWRATGAISRLELTLDATERVGTARAWQVLPPDQVLARWLREVACGPR